MVLVSAVVSIGLSLGACAQLGVVPPEGAPGAPDTNALPETNTLPEATAADVAPLVADPALISAPPPPRAANTQATLDTTTQAQRKQAAARPAVAPQTKLLGTTVASLGSPTEPGFWLKTPLVTSQAEGRVTNTANGKSSAVTLLPIDGPETAGSRLSLPAMRLIEASLTDLTELEVISDG